MPSFTSVKLATGRNIRGESHSITLDDRPADVEEGRGFKASFTAFKGPHVRKIGAGNLRGSSRNLRVCLTKQQGDAIQVLPGGMRSCPATCLDGVGTTLA